MNAVATVRRPAGQDVGRTTRRRELGAFYTPAHVADFMVARLRDLGPRSRVLEPSGGDGAFVHALSRAGLRSAQVSVWDIDDAVAPDMAAAGVAFTCRDSLLAAPDEPAYTHVVGNPPYLNKQSAYIGAHRRQLRARYADIGLSDTYAMFLVMALRQVPAGGQVSLLVSNTFLTLGIHRKLRELLTQTATLDEIVLLPSALFPDVNVSTAVLTVTKAPAPAGHLMRVWDLSATRPGQYAGGARYTVPQDELAANPAATFAFTPAARNAMRLLSHAPAKVIDVADGGLGMYTRDNVAHLRVVDHVGLGTLAPVPPGQEPLPAHAVDGIAWRAYHKRGGLKAWWGPAEHAVAWDEGSRAGYGIPASAQAGADADGRPRAGVVISGVAERFTARLATPGAMWESNKCFGLFPREESDVDAYALLAVLNSRVYGQLAAALNHTVSLQWRDVAALPWFAYTPAELEELSRLGACAVDCARDGHDGLQQVTVRIDEIVTGAALRVRSAAATRP